MPPRKRSRSGEPSALEKPRTRTRRPTARKGTEKATDLDRDGRTARRRSAPRAAVFTESFALIEPKRTEFLWWPWIPLGKLTIFEGEPDVGKSTMTLEWCAFVTTGARFPEARISGRPDVRSKRHKLPPSDVLLVGIEDDAGDTVRPRLDANGSDISRVHRMRPVLDENGVATPWVIPDDVDRLRDAIDEVRAKLVVIDPITAFISEKVRAGSDSSNRKALGYLADIAAETGAAIVLIRHLNKASGMDAKSRGGGSIAFTALARSVIVAGPQPLSSQEDGDIDEYPRNVLASTKGNLAPKPDSFAYSLRPARHNDDVATVEWHGCVAVTADEVVGADKARPDARKNAPERDEATRVLLEVLADGPMPSKEAIRVVRAETGVSEKTVHAARKAAGVETKRSRDDDGVIRGWVWMLPTSARFSTSTY